MRKDLTILGEALGASQEGMLAVEQFLKDNYLFRFNEMSGKVEYVTLPSDDKPVWRVLTQKALNSIKAQWGQEPLCILARGTKKTVRSGRCRLCPRTLLITDTLAADSTQKNRPSVNLNYTLIIYSDL